jgi:hypothetical protein
MKRIISLILIIFISVTLTYNFIYAINTNKTTIILDKKNNSYHDTTILKNIKEKKEEKDIKVKNDGTHHKATYYNTKPHKRVHRDDVPTAAYHHWKFLNKKFLLTNVKNGKSDTVVITDKHGMSQKHIDLSILAFDRLTNLDTISNLKKRESKRRMIGALIVKVKPIN